MSMTRFSLFAVVVVCLGLAGCSLLRLGGNPSGVSVIADSNYCGTPSQASEVHYFANPNSFQTWVDFRNIPGFSRDMARNGALVVEMGQRPTGGYYISLDGEKTGIHNGVLTIVMDWHAPRQDAAVSQALTSECVVLGLPSGTYHEVNVVDQIGNSRGRIKVTPPVSSS